MWISRCFFLFIIYSFIGWIFETLYCTTRDRKWENRGFLYGPLCPIYGGGAVAITYIANLFMHGNYRFWEIYVISLMGSAALEFITSWTLEKLFHAVWWDYSSLPFNVQGRVSLFTSCGFGVAGLVIVYGIAPYTERFTDAIPPICVEAVSLLFMAALASDITLTISALTDFATIVAQAEEALNVHMDTLVENAQKKTAGAVNRVILEREHLNERVHSMSRSYQSAIGRVRSFRYPRIRSEKLRAVLKNWKSTVGIDSSHRTSDE